VAEFAQALLSKGKKKKVKGTREQRTENKEQKFFVPSCLRGKNRATNIDQTTNGLYFRRG
jgi:hypothetical protein